MRRIPIQIEESTYLALKRRAFREGKSIAAIVRESLARDMSDQSPRKVSDFAFVGSGRSRRDSADRVSENHDRALAQAFARRRRKQR